MGDVLPHASRVNAPKRKMWAMVGPKQKKLWVKPDVPPEPRYTANKIRVLNQFFLADATPTSELPGLFSKAVVTGFGTERLNPTGCALGRRIRSIPLEIV